jgi:hypothetical protein
MNEKSNREPIPEDFGSIKAAAEFWETHSLADYWDQTREVDFDVDLESRVVLVPLEHDLANRLAALARQQGLSIETLVNLWLSERLRQAA